ncbi:MAG: hypothetical protein AAFX79_13500 [Planctomycetota bacterium]
MARPRDRLVSNPLKRDHVAAIAGVVPARGAPSDANVESPESDRPVEHERRVHRRRRPEATRQLKARFSVSEAEDIECFTRTLSGYLGCKINTSEVTRALWTLAVRSQDELAGLSARAPSLERPSYGNRFDMADYLDDMADFLLLALKQTRRK